jgi:TonB family protein
MKTNKINFMSPGRKLFLVIPAIILALAVFTLNASAQKSTTDKKEMAPPPPPPPPPPPGSDEKFITGVKEGKAYKTVDEMPMFPGGDEALLKYVAENTKYPKEAKEKGIQGQVFTRFIVKEDGTVSDVSILKGANQFLDDESIRVVRTLPKFSPGKLKGIPVPVWFILPITFTLK